MIFYAKWQTNRNFKDLKNKQFYIGLMLLKFEFQNFLLSHFLKIGSQIITYFQHRPVERWVIQSFIWLAKWSVLHVTLTRIMQVSIAGALGLIYFNEKANDFIWSQ